MFEIKNFDSWKEDTISGKFGSGASEKIWLANRCRMCQSGYWYI